MKKRGEPTGERGMRIGHILSVFDKAGIRSGDL